MKWNALILATVLTAAALPAGAVTSRVGTAEDFGFGFAGGQPMGVTSKYWLSSTSAIDGFAGYHFNSNFDAHIDYLLHTYSSFDITSGRLPMYIGLGGRILLGNDSQLGLRIPIGVSYLFPTSPLEIYAEVAPVIQLVTSIGADIDGQVGFRVYINYLK